MRIGDQVIKRFGLKRIYEVVSVPVKGRFFTYYEIRKEGKLSLAMGIRLKKIKL